MRYNELEALDLALKFAGAARVYVMRDPAARYPPVRPTNVYPLQPAFSLRTEIHSRAESTPVSEFGSYVIALYCVFRLGTIHEYLANRGINTHYNYFFAPLILVLVLVGGRFLSSVRTPTGKWLTGYVAWMTITIPTSYWRGGSANVVQTYLINDFLLFLALASFIVSIAGCKRFLSAVSLAMSCFVLVALLAGVASNTGRLTIGGSKFGNPNDLALHLLFLAPLVICFIRTRLESIASTVVHVGAVFALLAGTVLFFRTGSRGGLLALAAMLALWFFQLPLLKKLAPLLALVLALSAASLILPRATVNRYATIFSADVEVDAEDSWTVRIAQGSSEARKHEFWRSIELTLEHPVFGIGVGQYSGYMEAEDKKNGVHRNDIGTHNAYTQASSEMGMFGGILFVGVMVSTWRSLKRTREAIRGIPELQPLYSMAQGVTFSLLAYCVGAIFASLAYEIYLPIAASLAIGLSIAAGQGLRSLEEVKTS